MPVRKVVKKSKVKPKKTPRSVEDTPKKPFYRGPVVPGNQLWRNAKFIGRPTLFGDHKKLWEAAVEYFQWCDSNPLSRNEPVKFEGSMTVEAIEVGRPYTLTGLCIWLGCSESYFRNCRSDKSTDEFLTVVDMIEQTVRDQQLSGAIVNIFNGPLVSKLQELVDKTDVTTKGESIAAPAINIYNMAPPFAEAEKEVENLKSDKDDN